MAKGCFYYTVQTRQGRRWETASDPIRVTRIEDAMPFFEEICSKTPAHIAVRLVETKAVAQRDSVR